MNFFYFSEIKAEEKESRPRGIRDLPLPPIVDEPEVEPEEPLRKPAVKKEEGPKLKRPKYVCTSVRTLTYHFHSNSIVKAH